LRPCRWVGLPRRIPFVRRTPAAVPGPEWTGCSAAIPGRTERLSRPDQACHHSPLGSFQHPATWWDRRWPQPADRHGPSCAVCRPTSSRTRSRSSARPALRPARAAAGPEPSRVLLVLVLAGLVFALAGLVLTARPVLLRVAIALVGSARRLGALVAGGIAAIPRTSRPGWRRVAGSRTRGQCRPTPRPRRGDRRAGLGILHDQAEGGPNEGPEQRAHDHQELAATAK
jgi:hypothetical protein